MALGYSISGSVWFDDVPVHVAELLNWCMEEYSVTALNSLLVNGENRWDGFKSLDHCVAIVHADAAE